MADIMGNLSTALIIPLSHPTKFPFLLLAVFRGRIYVYVFIPRTKHYWEAAGASTSGSPRRHISDNNTINWPAFPLKCCEWTSAAAWQLLLVRRNLMPLTFNQAQSGQADICTWPWQIIYSQSQRGTMRFSWCTSNSLISLCYWS